VEVIILQVSKNSQNSLTKEYELLAQEGLNSDLAPSLKLND
jgi:hypothetical protein